MGKISLLTKEQKTILACIAEDKYFTNNFYFTGGSALAEFYLEHRISDDLDFFSEKKFDTQTVLTKITSFSQKYGFRFAPRLVEVVYRFEIAFPKGTRFMVDFGFYPFKRLEKGKKFQNLEIDSLKDIAANKLLTINQRGDVKDFVDLYFLLKEKYTIWDLIYATEKKFKRLDFDILLLAQDFLKVEDFEFLPRMVKPLSLEELKVFFRKLAKRVGMRAVEK